MLQYRPVTPVLVAAGVLAIGSAADAQLVLLEIDVSDLSAVVITATGASAIAEARHIVVPDPGGARDEDLTIDMHGVFANAPSLDVHMGASGPGDLTPRGSQGGTPFDRALASGSSTLTFGSELWSLFNRFANGADSSWFTTTDPAFTGAATVDFTGTGALSNAPGTTGDILAIDGREGGSFPALSPSTVIGSWQIVPAPATLSLLPIAGIAATRRRR